MSDTKYDGIQFDDAEQIVKKYIYKPCEPLIYVFWTPELGMRALKTGYTKRPLSNRIREHRRHYPNLKLIGSFPAVVGEGEDRRFYLDKELQKALTLRGCPRVPKDKFPDGLYYSNEFSFSTMDDVSGARGMVEEDFLTGGGKFKFRSMDDGLETEVVPSRSKTLDVRKRQLDAVDRFESIMRASRKGEQRKLLLSAVMRFGKTVTSLLCAKRMNYRRILVVSAKADVKTEWRDNVCEWKDFDGFRFIHRESFERNPNIIEETLNEGDTVVVFATLQDLMVDSETGSVKQRYSELVREHFDMILVDEGHYGAHGQRYGEILGNDDTTTVPHVDEDYDDAIDADTAELDRIVRDKLDSDVIMYLSGTPFRMLMSDEFSDEDIIANISYEDMLEDEREWYVDNLDKPEHENPNYGIPRMVRMAFNPSAQGTGLLESINSSGSDASLSELFRAVYTADNARNADTGNSVHRVDNGEHADPVHIENNVHDGHGVDNGEHVRSGVAVFEHPDEVLRFLHMLDGSYDGDDRDRGLYPVFDDGRIREAGLLKHVAMVLPSRAACDAMEALLIDNRESFKHLGDHEVINVSGKHPRVHYGPPVQVKGEVARAERENRRTLTLTVNRLLTGVTVRPWDSMMFCKNLSSPQEYYQAMYRLQSSYVVPVYDRDVDGNLVLDGDGNPMIVDRMNRKPQTLFMDFDPNRMFLMEEHYATMSCIASGGKGNRDTETFIEKELEYSPMILANGNMMGEVKARDIMDVANRYRSSRSIMDEVSTIRVDLGLMKNPVIRDYVNNGFSPLNEGKGFTKTKRISANVGATHDYRAPKGTPVGNVHNGNNVSSVDNGNSVDNAGTVNNASSVDRGKDRRRDKARADAVGRLRAMYMSLMFYSMLAGDANHDIRSLDDIIMSMEDSIDAGDARGLCLMKNLGLDVGFVRLVREHMNPFAIRKLDYQLCNVYNRMHDRGDSRLDNVVSLLSDLARISSSEVFTPDWVADEMVRVIPPERVRETVRSGSRIIDIASKSGEFAIAWVRYMTAPYDPDAAKGDPNGCGLSIGEVAKSLCAVPTSSAAYEFTRVVYESLGLDVDNIATKFDSYDLVTKYKNLPLVKKDGVKQRDAGIIKSVLGQNSKKFSEIALDDDEVDSDGEQVKISVIVGNPPYQDDRGTMSTHKSSLYDKFMMLSYGVSDCTVMIHPAKLLVKANNDFATALLNNPHYDYVKYYSDDSVPKVFDSVQIRGGLVVDVMDKETIHEPVNVFVPDSRMMGTYHKVWDSSNSNNDIVGLDSIIHYGKNTEYLDISMIHRDYPEYSRTYSESTVETDAFRIMPRVFVADRQSDDYVMVYGLLKMKHCKRWVHRKYLKFTDDENFSSYKVIVPQTGDGTIYHMQAKRLIGTPIICDRDTAHTRTFISVGKFQTISEANHCCKYIKTKFTRAMLGLLKFTPLTNPDKFRLIPLQDFTEDSDIDWSKTIPEIDQQLYAKYGLSDEEIEYIETHVQPMA